MATLRGSNRSNPTGGWRTPTAYSLLIHHIITGKTFITAVTDVLTWLSQQDDEDDLAQQIRTGLSQDITAPLTRWNKRSRPSNSLPLR